MEMVGRVALVAAVAVVVVLLQLTVDWEIWVDITQLKVMLAEMHITQVDLAVQHIKAEVAAAQVLLAQQEHQVLQEMAVMDLQQQYLVHQLYMLVAVVVELADQELLQVVVVMAVVEQVLQILQ